jgi:hypothetical protein
MKFARIFVLFLMQIALKANSNVHNISNISVTNKNFTNIEIQYHVNDEENKF